MNQSVLPGFEFLLMGTKEIIQEYPKAQTVGELDKMLLKVCHEANNESISDAEFRGMIYDLMLRKVELMDAKGPAYLKISHSLSNRTDIPYNTIFPLHYQEVEGPRHRYGCRGLLVSSLAHTEFR